MIERYVRRAAVMEEDDFRNYVEGMLEDVVRRVRGLDLSYEEFEEFVKDTIDRDLGKVLGGVEEVVILGISSSPVFVYSSYDFFVIVRDAYDLEEVYRTEVSPEEEEEEVG